MMYFVLLFLLTISPAYAAPGVAVVQSAAPTSNGGTQDFTSSGFGTPVCAMFFVSYATTNDTEVSHAMYSVGFSDFTNHVAVVQASEDTATTTDTAGNASSTASLLTMLITSQALDGTATASTITDGVRLTWADAPPIAYLVTAVMFNSSVVENCTAGVLSASSTQDATASVSGLGWQPNVLITGTNNNNTHARLAIGMAIDDSGIVQYSGGLGDQDALSTSTVVQVLRNDRINSSAATGVTTHELTSWDSGGFTVTTRDSNIAINIRYLAIRLATGVAAKLIACDSPTSTGNKSCTGAGWTPQAGILLQTNVSAINTYDPDAADNESFGVSAFTAAQSSAISISSDDGVASANTTSIVDNKAVRLRKDGADFLTATLSQFQSDGVDFNYSVTDSTARLGALLLFQSTDTTRRRGRIIEFQ